MAQGREETAFFRMSDEGVRRVFQPPGEKLEERPAVPGLDFRPELRVFLSAGLSLSTPTSGVPGGRYSAGLSLLHPDRTCPEQLQIRLYKIRHNIVQL